MKKEQLAQKMKRKKIKREYKKNTKDFAYANYFNKNAGIDSKVNMNGLLPKKYRENPLM